MASDFGILGELQVTHDGVQRDLGSLRQRGLLARLLIRRGQPVTSDWLIEELWPGEVADSARHTLHVYISRLRSALGDERERLANDVAGYRLHLEPAELDAHRFEQLAMGGRAALAEDEPTRASELLSEALAQWRGPALVEFATEPFADAEATRLDQLRLAALEARIGADLTLGRHLDLIEELRGLTIEQPFREVAWEQYMLALYRAGRQADALQAYAEARMRLVEELGIEPGPALKRMQEQVLTHDATLDLASAAAPRVPADPKSPPDNLPLQRTTFIGRERDLAIAGELLSASRLLTLTGAPGAGKTRMALRLASDHRHLFPDGLWFASLAGVSDARRLEPAISSALDSPDSGGRDAGDQPASEDTTLSERLRRRRVLLVLDNMEQLDGAAGAVDRLLDAAPDATILATSRAPLGVAGEQEFPVLPLQVPPLDAPLAPGVLSNYDAVTLLVARARAADPRFEVTPENAAALAGIAVRLDGLPLAIELGAGHLRALTPQSLLDRLERRLPLLTAGARDVVGRHQTLRSAIAWSYELLDPADQRLFRRLASFVSGFTAEAAAAVADQPLDETWTGIESLLAQSLLYRPVAVGEARFAMLQTVREFAVEQSELAGELEDTLDRHTRWYLELAEHAADDAAAAGSDDRITELSPELDEIQSALRRCTQAGQREVGLRLAGATWRVWQVAGRITEGREWLARMLAWPGPADTVRADALVALAGLEYWQADYTAARAAYTEALGLYRTAGDRTSEAEVLYGLSMTATWSGDPAQGARLATEARDLFEALGARAKVGETLMAEGFAVWQQRDYTAARPLWEQALAISRELGADTLAVTQVAGLAGIEFDMGAVTDAVRIALDALDQACDLDNVALCVWMLDLVAAFAVIERPLPAVRLAGAADALRAASGGGMRVEDLHIEPARLAAERLEDRILVARAWTEGRALSLQDAIDEARNLRVSIR